MTKPVLLLLAFQGLGDDDFQVRRLCERYVAASGYDAVLLHRLAPHLTGDLQTKATLRKLEKRYYAAWDARLAREDWREYPSLLLLSPWCRPDYWDGRTYNDRRGRFDGWAVRRNTPFTAFLLRYARKALAVREACVAGQLGDRLLPGMPVRCGGVFNGATLELLKDLRSGGAPAWAAELLLRYLRWRNALMEWRHGVRDENYSRRAS